MRQLGKVFNFSPKGSIVVRATTTPRIGQMVCDNKGRSIGKVIRITGPVSSPYVLVSSLAKDDISMFRLSGKQVFLDETMRQPYARERRPRPGMPSQNKRPQRSEGFRNHKGKDPRSKGRRSKGDGRRGQR